MFHYPHGDLHELNLDWFLEQWRKFKDSFTNTFTTSSETLTAGSAPTVNVSYDSGTGIYDFHFGLPEAGEPTQTNIWYQAGTSPSTPPTGTWQTNPPIVPEGQYLWTKNQVVYNTGYYFTFYSVAKQGISGTYILHLTGNISANTTSVTFADANITANMRIINCQFSNATGINGNVTATTTTGSITVSGDFVEATNIYMDLAETI